MKYPIEELERDIQSHITRLATMRSEKGNDYSGTSPDTLANLRPCGILGVVVRISDKFMRLKAHYIDGVPMKNESIEDTWDDLINYSLYGRICHDQNSTPQVPPASAPQVQSWEEMRKETVKAEVDKLGEMLK